MYSNTALYGGDAHIFTRDEVATLTEDHDGAAASLCEEHGVTQPSDVFHVSDVAPNWRAFLQEDEVCDECAKAWKRRLVNGWDVDPAHVAARHLEQTTLALGEQHRLKRLDTGEVVEATVVETTPEAILDDGDTLYEVVQDAREDEQYALSDEDRERFQQEFGSPQYAAFVEYGRDDQHGPARVVDTDISVASDVQEAGRQHLGVGQQEVEFSVDVELDQEGAEALAKMLGDRVADRVAGDRR